jgi:hypothetical protein
MVPDFISLIHAQASPTKGASVDGWEGIATAVATAAQAIIVGIAAIFALRQVWQARQARLASTLVSIRNDIDSPESRENRYELFHNLPDDLTSPLTKKQTKVVDRVVVEYEFIGALVFVNKLIDFKVIARLYAPSTERSWHRVKPWIESQRDLRNDERYATNFQKLAEESIEFNRQAGRGPLQPFRQPDSPDSLDSLRTSSETNLVAATRDLASAAIVYADAARSGGGRKLICAQPKKHWWKLWI